MTKTEIQREVIRLYDHRASLPPRLRKVIERLYGPNTPGRTRPIGSQHIVRARRDLARELNVTGERVQQLECEAAKRLVAASLTQD